MDRSELAHPIVDGGVVSSLMSAMTADCPAPSTNAVS
jgi:hypothetical protein